MLSMSTTSSDKCQPRNSKRVVPTSSGFLKKPWITYGAGDITRGVPTNIQNLAPAEDRARLVLRRLMAFRETSGAELARRTGYTPQTISDKVKGSNRVR